MSYDFCFYNYNPVYCINGVYFELDLDTCMVKDIFILENEEGALDLFEDNRDRLKWFINLKVDLNHHQNRLYKIYMDILNYFKDNTEITYRAFDYRAASDLAIVIFNNNIAVPYYIKQVFKYISYDVFGGLLPGDLAIEVPSDKDVKEFYVGTDERGYAIYKYKSATVYVKDGKIEEGIDLSKHAKNFVIWASVQCAADFIQECKVYYQKERLEIKLGTSRILYRFAESSSVYANIIGLPKEKRTAKFKNNVNCMDCIDFVDSVFNYTKYMTDKNTGGSDLSAF